MDWGDLLTGLALVLIIEGLLPFIHPDGWKGILFKVIQMDSKQLRFLGLTSMIIGLILLSWVR